MLSKPVFLDCSENGIYFKPGDQDGFIICETENEKTGVYIYYSEIDIVIENFKKIKDGGLK